LFARTVPLQLHRRLPHAHLLHRKPRLICAAPAHLGSTNADLRCSIVNECPTLPIRVRRRSPREGHTFRSHRHGRSRRSTECLLDPSVQHVLSIVRCPTGQQHAKLIELVRKHFFDHSAFESQLVGYDACFFCLGVSSAGMSEEGYARVTYDATMALAPTLACLNPDMTFIYVSGAWTDSTEKGRTMSSKAKSKTRFCFYLSKRPTCSAPPGSSHCMAFSQGAQAIAFSTYSPNLYSRC